MLVQARNGAVEAPALVIDTGGVTELALLIPDCELAALEELARRDGVTAGRLIRRLIRAYLAAGTAPRLPSCRPDDRPVESSRCPNRGGTP